MPACPACATESAGEAQFCAACGSALDPAAAETRAGFGAATASGAGGVSGGYFGAGEATRFLPGAMVAGRYRVIGLLGRGGMGEVYRADDLKLGRPVALKFLPKALERDPQRLKQFLNEVRVALKVTHPNVCRVHDIGEIDAATDQAHGRHYISMEYIDGEDLASLLRRIGRLPSDKAVVIARQICAGLAAAHAEGILHRDLKPANVMIDGRGRAKITDFGLASLAEAVSGADIGAGTPAYMAPEQIAGQSVSVKSDVYALGLVLFELFTGRPVFQSDSIPDLRRMHSETPPSSPSSHVRGIDPAVESVVLRCLAKRPEDRPPSVLAVSAALPGGDPLAAALAAGETPSPELVAEAGGKFVMRPAVAAALALAALALFFAATRWAGTMASVNFLPLHKSPAVLADRAQGIVEHLGYEEPAYKDPVDQAWGFFAWADVFIEVAESDSSDDRWEGLRDRPDAIAFWYRQSPIAIVPNPTGGEPIFTRGLVRMNNPDSKTPGQVEVILDLDGRLRRVEVVPKRLSTIEAPEPDWGPLFEAAELDPERFAEVRPVYQRFQAPDHRRAWVGTRAELPDVRLHVEAGAYEGRPTLFNVATPESLEILGQDPAPSRLSGSDATLFSLQPLIILIVFVAAIRLAAANLRQGRADRLGALRFATFIAVLYLINEGLRSHHLFSNRWLIELWPFLVGASFVGLATWTLYVAVEPVGRQVWPQMFVSSSRLLSLQRIPWRDPLIGQSVLIGLIFGTLVYVVSPSGPLRATIVGVLEGAPRLVPYDIDLWLGPRVVLGEVLGVAVNIAVGLLLVVTLVILRHAFKRQWIAVVLGVVAWTLMSGAITPGGIAFGLVGSVLAMTALLRWGVVAMLVARVTTELCRRAPATDLSAWHSQASLIALAVFAALAAYGLWAATGGRRTDPLLVEDRPSRTS